MRTTLAALSLAATIGLVCCQSAGAVPAATNAMKVTAMAASPLQQTQYREYRTRHYFVKCYRVLVLGPYRCHHYRRRWW
jgi:hypothetical protein